MKSCTSAEARSLFAEVLNSSEDDAVLITKHNKPFRVILSYEMYCMVIESIEILMDPETLNHIKSGLLQMYDKKWVKWDEVRQRVLRTK